MKHKLFTFILALTASVGTLFAEIGTCGDNLTWDLTDSVLTISGTGVMKDYDYYNKRYAPWYSSRQSIRTVTISDGVTSIGSYAFYYCDRLRSVAIPNSVTSIGTFAFRYSNISTIKFTGSIAEWCNKNWFPEKFLGITRCISKVFQ